MGKISSLEDGSLVGLSEQLSTLSKDFGFLFKNAEKPSVNLGGICPAESTTKSTADPFIEGFGY